MLCWCFFQKNQKDELKYHIEILKIINFTARHFLDQHNNLDNKKKIYKT